MRKESGTLNLPIDGADSIVKEISNGVWPFDIRELDGLGLTLLTCNIIQQAHGGKYRRWMGSQPEASDGKGGRWHVSMSTSQKRFVLTHEFNSGAVNHRRELRTQTELAMVPWKRQERILGQLLEHDTNPLDGSQTAKDHKVFVDKLTAAYKTLEENPPIELLSQEWVVTFDDVDRIFA